MSRYPSDIPFSKTQGNGIWDRRFLQTYTLHRCDRIWTRRSGRFECDSLTDGCHPPEGVETERINITFHHIRSDYCDRLAWLKSGWWNASRYFSKVYQYVGSLLKRKSSHLSLPNRCLSRPLWSQPMPITFCSIHNPAQVRGPIREMPKSRLTVRSNTMPSNADHKHK